MATAAFFIGIVLYIVAMMVALIPIKLAAVWLTTGKSGWWACFIAGIAGMILTAISFAVIPYKIVSIFITALGFMIFLQTNYVRGLIIALVAFVFYFLLPLFIEKHLHPKQPVTTSASRALYIGQRSISFATI